MCLFLKDRPQYRGTLVYHIVGSGSAGEEDHLERLVTALGLSDNIFLHGRKLQEDVKHLFDMCNIGISYVPQIPCYDHQPPTKTFEYVNSGMSCLATKTTENKKCINDMNGILCEDSPESFSCGLGLIVENFPGYRSSDIRRTLERASWDNIAKDLAVQLRNY